jgi:hypothetical protein
MEISDNTNVAIAYPRVEADVVPSQVLIQKSDQFFRLATADVPATVVCHTPIVGSNEITAEG